MKSVKRSNARHKVLADKAFWKSAKVQTDRQKMNLHATAEYHETVVKRQKARNQILGTDEKKQLYKSSKKRYSGKPISFIKDYL